jgi:hypothetical protein
MFAVRCIYRIAVCGGALFFSCQAQSADCTSRFSRLSGDQKLPEVREQVCSTDAATTAGDLKITFLRLSEAVAGSLAKKDPIPEFEAILKGPTVSQNEVFQELVSIFDKFGYKENRTAESIGLVLNVKTLGPGQVAKWKSVELPVAPRPANSVQAFWTISSPFANTLDAEVSMKEARDTIMKTDGWPSGFKQTYICRRAEILCTLTWTHLDLRDLDVVERDTFADEKKAGSALDDGAPNNDGSNVASDALEWPHPRYKANFSLFRYLGASGWPREFLIASSNNGECGDVFTFHYHPRPLVLDVAVIENASAAPTNVLDVVGIKSAEKGIRRASAGPASDPAAPLSQTAATIPPNGRLLVPLRISFLDPVAPWRTARRVAEAKAMYQLIQSQPPQSFARALVGTDRPQTLIKKKRASFSSPQLPEDTEFVFGPEIFLRGLMLAKNSVALGQPSFDLLTLDQSDLEHYQEEPIVQLTQNIEPGGSCPILYSFANGEWVKHGKVIHEADGLDNVHTSVVAVDPAARKFRIAEEEPEIATIKQVSLRLGLRNGSRITLAPQPRSDGSARSDFKVPAYTKVDLEFVLPAEHAPEDVVSSEIAISGFYQRYSSVAARLQ